MPLGLGADKLTLILSTLILITAPTLVVTMAEPVEVAALAFKFGAAVNPAARAESEKTPKKNKVLSCFLIITVILSLVGYRIPPKFTLNSSKDIIISSFNCQ